MTSYLTSKINNTNVNANDYKSGLKEIIGIDFML